MVKNEKNPFEILSIIFSVLGVYGVRKLLKINMKGEKEND